ncbi:hypothetical protein AGR56_08165 [Clostridium sp. DMHC 10]|nr:hypothetical protein AGR56_08165 [Clostridium sp. DMHC 10]
MYIYYFGVWKNKKSKICHELCHIFINNQIKGKSLIDIKLVEGVCECISEQFILEEGTISLRKKCAIAFDVLNINTCNILLKELDNIKKNSDTYSLVTYNIVPYIVKMIINQIGLDGLLNRIRKNKTLKEVITNTFNGFEKFWTILQESLMEEINVREYNELYAQIIMKQYENIMEDISQDAYSKLKIKFKNIYELLNKEEYILVKKELTEF